MDRSRALKVAGLALLAALVMLALWLLFGRPAPTGHEPQATPTTTGGGEPEQPLPSGPVEPQPEQTGAVVAARVWAERFASWSNEDGFTNLQLLASRSTPQVQDFLASYRRDLQQRYPVERGYHGVTGRALSPVLESLAGDDAQVNVALQLAESTSTVPTVTNRTLQLRLVHSGGGWLVDFVKWAD